MAKEQEVCRTILNWYGNLFNRYQNVFEASRDVYFDNIMKNYDDFYRHNIPDGIKEVAEETSRELGKTFSSSFSDVMIVQLKMLKIPILGRYVANKIIDAFDESKKDIIPFLFAVENNDKAITHEKVDTLTKEHVKQEDFCKALTDYLGLFTESIKNADKTKLGTNAEEVTHLIINEDATAKYLDKVFEEIVRQEAKRIYG